MGNSGKITTAKLDKVEAWCRTAALLITKPMNIMKPQNVKRQLLDSLDNNQLRFLARYFNRCTKVSMQASLIGTSRSNLLEIIENGITIVQSGEATIMLPFEFEHFITTETMAQRLGKGKNKEFIAQLDEQAKELINSWSIYLPGIKSGKGLEGSEVIIYATKHNHTRYYMSPKLEPYFVELLKPSPVSLSDEKREHYLSPTELLGIIRGGNDSTTFRNLEDLKNYLEELMRSKQNLSIDGGNLPAREYILWRSYSAVNNQTFYTSKEAVPYILYNYCCPRSKLENGNEFITNTEICRVLGLEKTRDNYTAIQEILKEKRDKNCDKGISIERDGAQSEAKVGDVIRRLSAKRIEPSYFVHRDAVSSIITKQDVVLKRADIKERETRQR